VQARDLVTKWLAVQEALIENDKIAAIVMNR